MNKTSFVDPKLRKEIKDIYEKVQNKIINELRFVNPYGDIVMKVIDTLYAGGRKKPQEIINFEQKLEEARKSLVNASIKIANVQFINGSLEDIRTAALGNFCVDMKYQKLNSDVVDDYLIAPYAICKTSKNDFILRAIKMATGQPQSFRVERIYSVQVTGQTFDPKYEVDVSMKIVVPSLPVDTKSVPVIWASDSIEKSSSLIFVVKGKTYTLTEDFKDLKKGTEIKVKEIDGKKVTISAGKEKLEVSLKSLLESIKL